MDQFKKITGRLIDGIWRLLSGTANITGKTIRRIFLALCACLLVSIICSGVLFAYLAPLYNETRETEYQNLSHIDKNSFALLKGTSIYDKDNKKIGELSTSEYQYVPIKNISDYIQEGYIAVEDNRFKYHSGIDLKGLLRAGVSLVKNRGAVTQGGSTITQQVVKNSLLSQEQTFTRKFIELFLAVDLEKKFTKADIMEFYCNTNYYGNRCYGVEAASQYYFGCSAEDVTVSQAAVLVGVSNSPSRYDPVANPDDCLKKRNSVLSKMLKNGVIGKTEYEKAVNEELHIVGKTDEKQNEQDQTSYALYCATLELMEEDGFPFLYVFESKKDYEKYTERYRQVYSETSQKIRNGGYDIYTSLDTGKQKQLQKTVDSVLDTASKEKQEDGRYALQGAAVCIDNETGYVVAVVGGRGTKDQYNRAFLSSRQPGSTIKPLLDYAPAFETGFYYPSKVMNDGPVENGPKNSNGKYTGSISMRNAVKHSVNTIAWQTLDGIGTQTGLSYLEKMKFSTLSYVDNHALSISIGGFTNGVRVCDMAKGYSILASGGTCHDRTCIRKIVSQTDGVVYRDKNESTPVYSCDTAFLMTDCLKGVLKEGGTGAACSVKGQICAAKTGTTNASKDGWFCGYSRYYTTAVWVGRDDNKPVNGMYGATYSGRIWQDYMTKIHKNLPKKDFDKPETIVRKNINGLGEAVAYNTGKSDYFSSGAKEKADAIEKEQSEKIAEKNAKKAVREFEDFQIVTVEDCYKIDGLYQDALSLVSVLSDDAVRTKYMTRVENQYEQLKKELSSWKNAMEAYETEQKQQRELERKKQEEEAARRREENEKNAVINRFKTVIQVIQNTEIVTEHTYELLDKASSYLSACTPYDEYESLRKEYETERKRIPLLEQKNKQEEAERRKQKQEQEERRERQEQEDRERLEKEETERTGDSL